MSEGLAVSIKDKIKSLAGDIALREGCLLYDLEFLEAGSRILRVYIDKEPGGASLEDCVNVSRGLNLALDVEDIIPGGNYDLEVSTPGLERKMTQDWHFQKALGKTIQVKFEEPEGTNRSVKGVIKEVDDKKMTLEEGKKTYEIPFSKVLKAKMVFVGAEKKKASAPFKKR